MQNDNRSAFGFKRLIILLFPSGKTTGKMLFLAIIHPYLMFRFSFPLRMFKKGLILMIKTTNHYRHLLRFINQHPTR